MFSDEESEIIVTRFQKNRHFLNQNTLGMVIQYVREYEGNSEPVSQLIAKINEMTIMENERMNEKILKRAINLLHYSRAKGKS